MVRCAQPPTGPVTPSAPRELRLALPVRQPPHRVWKVSLEESELLEIAHRLCEAQHLSGTGQTGRALGLSLIASGRGDWILDTNKHRASA